MLSRVAISRALAMRGVSTSAIKKDYMYFPGYMMSVSQHKEFLEHPNRNPDNYSKSHKNDQIFSAKMTYGCDFDFAVL